MTQSHTTVPHLLLIGCGNMGGAIAHSVLAQNIANHVTIIDPALSLPHALETHQSVTHYDDINGADDLSDISICLLAVKPQLMDNICTTLVHALPKECVILSIAAGKTITAFENVFGEGTPIIRAMPNTPAMIGEGVSVLCANKSINNTQKQAATALMSACGLVEWVEEESLIDAVTAISGSGPAYLFYFIECLEAAATARGLSPELARALARQTVIGSAALAKDNADTPPATLREKVTSKGGTTAAALDILMNGKFKEIIDQATAAAQKRSKALS